MDTECSVCREGHSSSPCTHGEEYITKKETYVCKGCGVSAYRAHPNQTLCGDCARKDEEIENFDADEDIETEVEEDDDE